MNPYNQQPYGFPQQTPGPPQPQWQAPPRRQGWGDPRLPGQPQQQPQSPISPYHTVAVPASNAFGPPLPPPPPPPSQYPPPPQFDTHQWGVRYNQTLGGQNQNQSQEPKPALPPRPSSVLGRVSPQPHQTASLQHPAPAPSQQQYPTSWNDPYHTSSTVPPPPPPRPAEYQAQIQATQHNRTGTPHQEYSFQPPSHHYDPPTTQQNAWNTQHGQSTGQPYHSTPPPPPQTSAVLDGPLVSPIEPTSGYWSTGHQPHSSTSQAPSHYNPAAGIQPPDFKPAFSQALAFGGPSDWEHYDPNAPPPEQTPTSPPSNPLYQGPISPPQIHANLPAPHQTPKPEPALPTHAVEIGVASPVTPRRDSRTQPPPVVDSIPSPPSRPVDEGPPSAGEYSGNVSARSDSLNDAGNIDRVIQAWNAPLNVRSAHDSTPRPESRASAPRVTSPDPGLSPVSVKVVDPYADLEPEFKASLKRYAAMLRREAEAEHDDEKFEIFQSFVTKELRLRSLLYGVELKKEAAKEVKKAASLADIQALLPNAAFPSNETSRDPGRSNQPVENPSGSLAATSQGQQPHTQPSISTVPEVTPTNVVQKEQPQLDIPRPADTVSSTPESSAKPTQQDRPKSKDGPRVIIPVSSQEEAYSPGGRPVMKSIEGGSEEESYSPGGRPLVTKPADGDGEAYSPGGRPIAGKANTTSSMKPPPISTTIQQERHQPSMSMLSPSNDAPMVIEDYATPEPPSPSMNAPMVVTTEASHGQASPGRPAQGNSDKPVVPIKFEPPRPAYTPFRYNTGVQEEKSKTLQPADQAYSSLRNSVADSGRLMVQDTALLAPARPSSSGGKKEHEEAFIGLIRKQSMAVRQKTPGPGSVPAAIRPGSEPKFNASSRPEPPLVMRVGTPATASMRVERAPVDPLKAAVTALRSLLPPVADIFSPIEANPEHPKLKLIKSKIDSIPDAFSFIHDAVVEWDRTNRLVRKEQEVERQARQEESEGHIDALFNDNEIGYADIGELEAEFKLKEAERRFAEDQAELESFTSQVFVVVTEKLQKEITELMTAYTMAIDLLDIDSLAVSRCFKANDRSSAVRMTEVMSYVLTLFNKIEVRHTKLAEAHVERERRRKRLELTVLYANGDVQGVKKLEKEFAVAEKMAVLHEARSRDTRANKLMDSFDRATVRGLGDNQVFTDEVFDRLQEVKKALDAGALQNEKERLYEPEGARETLSLAQNALDTVMSDSRRLLALSNEADVLLNDADYNVSVAEARVANADKPTYANLESEKAKEDTKLIEDMNVRISSVTKGPQEGISLIRELIDRIGDDPAHQERIKKALEAAKMRNANGAANEGG
ncbi:hypothetical protein Z517_02249 [Fonsecaea pedrosoi CBS 271.37]|uniref:Uncharacterized protein n=1 Tax=Fonsecaea pedrosoi CBS 271.37 TaxID=1442368 RepID=A0A0D2DZ39_9EURO|nr:uncharacterized protein Z517_02249 [Fonsecaea pedrosoi CBS 271.37]KIW83006.1 hypothetical protein Z517_02249 [Fonsecaea pedrosoi CBS 271.37]